MFEQHSVKIQILAIVGVLMVGKKKTCGSEHQSKSSYHKQNVPAVKEAAVLIEKGPLMVQYAVSISYMHFQRV